MKMLRAVIMLASLMMVNTIFSASKISPKKKPHPSTTPITEPATPTPKKKPYPSTTPFAASADYPNTISNDTANLINVKIYFENGTSMGPIALPGKANDLGIGGAVMLPGNLAGISQFEINGQKITQCRVNGKVITLPSKSSFSTIAYTDTKNGPALICK